jgi:hypothetical protein
MTDRKLPAVPPPPPRRKLAAMPVDFGPPPFGGDEPRHAPSFDDSPTEAPTGNTSAIVGEWRLLLQAFDELDDIGKAELCQLAHVVLRAHVKRKNRADR